MTNKDESQRAAIANALVDARLVADNIKQLAEQEAADIVKAAEIHANQIRQTVDNEAALARLAVNAELEKQVKTQLTEANQMLSDAKTESKNISQTTSSKLKELVTKTDANYSQTYDAYQVLIEQVKSQKEECINSLTSLLEFVKSIDVEDRLAETSHLASEASSDIDDYNNKAKRTADSLDYSQPPIASVASIVSNDFGEDSAIARFAKLANMSLDEATSLVSSIAKQNQAKEVK